MIKSVVIPGHPKAPQTVKNEIFSSDGGVVINFWKKLSSNPSS